jgi:hypothetical protein
MSTLTGCRNYSETKAINRQLHPYFITGFSDGEACFSVKITKSKTHLTGWRVQLCFEIGLDKRDIALLKKIQLFFGVGKIYVYGSTAYYKVISIKDLAAIIDHFDKYPLITQKYADFILFKMIVEIINRKEHLSNEGLRKIVGIRASMNLGLSESLKVAFPSLIPVSRPQVEFKGILDPHWLAGFVDGEGCFYIIVTKSSSIDLGFQVQLKFKVTQHSREAQLMKSLIEYLGCGRYEVRPNGFAGDFIVSKFTDINEKIIPFFNLYSPQGVKSLDFAAFCKAVVLMKDKLHLTPLGLEQIKCIKSEMNRKRDLS